MKTKRIPKLRRGASDAEVARWAKAHNVFDRLDSGIAEVVEDHSDLDHILEEAVLQDNTAQLNMRIPPAMKAVLSRLARERTPMLPPSPAFGLRNGSNKNSKRVDFHAQRTRPTITNAAFIFLLPIAIA